MAQKSIAVMNKSGYSMFWNSMWDNKNNFSKFLQNDFFIKSFINYFFIDFFQNQFIYFYNFKKINLNNLNYTYHLKYLQNNKKNINIYLNNIFNDDLYISKIWLFKYHNWIIIYLFVFSKTNSCLITNKVNYLNNNFYTCNIINNYYINLLNNSFNSDFLENNILFKNNF